MNTRRYYLALAILAGLFIVTTFFDFPIWIAFLILVILTSFLIFNVRRDYDQNVKNIQSKYHRDLSVSDNERLLKTRQLEIVFENIPAPLALVNLKGEIVMHNTSFGHFFTKPKTGIVDYLNDALQMEIRMFIKDSYLKKSSDIKNIHILDRDYMAISIPFLENNRYSGCMLTFQDITVYLEGDRMQKRFIADASHELRTPLAAIKGMVEILNRPEFNDDATRHEFMQQIEVESQRMETIIQDLLTLSRISSNKIILHTQAVTLYDVIENSYSSLKPEFANKGIKFINATQMDAKVELDPQKMHNVFTNLLTNAINQTDFGFVRVDCQQDGKDLLIHVKDSGAGIPQADLDHIFNRFYRVEKHRSRGSGGSGLGLAIVKGIVEAHGGSISVKSVEGEGTTFTIRLPQS